MSAGRRRARSRAPAGRRRSPAASWRRASSRAARRPRPRSGRPASAVIVPSRTGSASEDPVSASVKATPSKSSRLTARSGRAVSDLHRERDPRGGGPVELAVGLAQVEARGRRRSRTTRGPSPSSPTSPSPAWPARRRGPPRRAPRPRRGSPRPPMRHSAARVHGAPPPGEGEDGDEPGQRQGAGQHGRRRRLHGPAVGQAHADRDQRRHGSPPHDDLPDGHAGERGEGDVEQRDQGRVVRPRDRERRPRPLGEAVGEDPPDAVPGARVPGQQVPRRRGAARGRARR